MVGRYGRISGFGITFVIAATGTEIADATGLAPRVTAIQALFHKAGQAGFVDTRPNRTKLRQRGTGKAMTEIQSPFGVHRQ